jgi:hypothetical protein
MVEIWRSESVIQVFIDFWLSYGEREMPLFGVSPRVRKYVLLIIDNEIIFLVMQIIIFYSSSFQALAFRSLMTVEVT